MVWYQFEGQPLWGKAPSLALPTLHGDSFSLESVWYRANPVLVFLRENGLVRTQDRNDQFIALGTAISYLDGMLILIWSGSKPPRTLGRGLEPGQKTLLDRDNRAWDTFQALIPAPGQLELMIFLLDRYGGLFSAYAGSPGENPVPVDEIVGWLEYIELQCPE